MQFPRMVHTATDRKVVVSQAEYDAALSDGWCASRADIGTAPAPTPAPDTTLTVDAPAVITKRRGRPRKH